MVCSNCGYNNQPGNTRCANCGNQLTNNMSSFNNNNTNVNSFNNNNGASMNSFGNNPNNNYNNSNTNANGNNVNINNFSNNNNPNHNMNSFNGNSNYNSNTNTNMNGSGNNNINNNNNINVNTNGYDNNANMNNFSNNNSPNHNMNSFNSNSNYNSNTNMNSSGNNNINVNTNTNGTNVNSFNNNTNVGTNNFGNVYDNVINSSVDKTSIRVALKSEAKACKKGKLLLLMILFSSIIGFELPFVFQLFGPVGSVLNFSEKGIIAGFLAFFIVFIESFVMMFVCFGTIFASLEILRHQTFSIDSVFKNVFSKIKYVFITGLLVSVYMFCSFFLVKVSNNIVLLIIMLLILIALIYIIPAFTIMMRICADNEYQKGSIKDVIKDSFRLIKGHRTEYYAMIFSFFWIDFLVLSIPAYLYALMYAFVVVIVAIFGGTVGSNSKFFIVLAALTVFNIFLVLKYLPYTILSISNFYRYIKGERQITEPHKGIPNVGLIAIFIACVIASIGIIIGFIAYSGTNYLNTSKMQSFADTANGIVSTVQTDYLIKGSSGTMMYDINAINEISEKKLSTSPFGNNYQHANVIVTSYNNEYEYHICLDDGKYVINTYEDDINKNNVFKIDSNHKACG